MADQYLAIHGKANKPREFKNGKYETKDKNDSKSQKGGSTDLKEKSKEWVEKRTCYKCNKQGHIALNCDSKQPGSASSQQTGLLSVKENKPSFLDRDNKYKQTVHINGQKVTAHRDTGCSQTLVKASLVPKMAYIEGETLSMKMADGRVKRVPLAMVYIETANISGNFKVGVLDTLPEYVLLGNDMDLEATVMRCITRGQAQKSDKLQKEADLDMHQTGVKARPVSEEAELTELMKVLLNDDSDTNKENASSEHDDVKVNSNHDSEVEIPSANGQAVDIPTDHETGSGTPERNMIDQDIVDMGPEKLRKLQSTDPSLEKIKQLVLPLDKVHNERTCFFYKDGLLYRKWCPRKADWQPGEESDILVVEQLVVPKLARKMILKLAHDIPLAGHLGVEKTKARILTRYYWPGIFMDVANYCRTCTACQKTARKSQRDRVNLMTVPIVGNPFEKVAIDMIGPLPRTKRGNRYALVLVDYATRYPEVVAVPSMEAARIADELFTIFSRVGVPANLLSDQGTNFTSKLMEEVCQLLGIKKLKTTPYHPQANGLVERFNGTLKAMLKKLSADEPDAWDRYLPYLLFAYREVPQASTGFSPFELLYGRQVRGPLDVLKEAWTNESPKEGNVIQYVLEMREHISQMTEMAQDKLAQVQRNQKRWYDKTARAKSFNPGEKVLVLLPSASNKLQAEWQGPFKVLRRTSPVDYEGDTGSSRKQKKVYHVNMLRKFNERENEAFLANAFLADFIDESSPGDDLLDLEIQPRVNASETWRDVKLGENLTAEQKQQAEALLEEFSDVFTDVPGRTHLIEHNFTTTNEKPIRQKAYRLPQALQETVKKEIDQMLAQGTMKPSKSP